VLCGLRRPSREVIIPQQNPLPLRDRHRPHVTSDGMIGRCRDASDYMTVVDCGRIINPMTVVRGQVMVGSLVQGARRRLAEDMRYYRGRSVLDWASAALRDYLAATAAISLTARDP